MWKIILKVCVENVYNIRELIYKIHKIVKYIKFTKSNYFLPPM